MKEIVEPVPSERSTGAQEFSNRRLVRPSLPPREQGHAVSHSGGEKRERQGGFARRSGAGEQTNAENFYYQKQMQARTPMVVILKDGERVQGIIEWYDKACIKLTRNGSGSNMVIYKGAIKYMYKESEGVR